MFLKPNLIWSCKSFRVQNLAAAISSTSYSERVNFFIKTQLAFISVVGSSVRQKSGKPFSRKQPSTLSGFILWCHGYQSDPELWFFSLGGEPCFHSRLLPTKRSVRFSISWPFEFTVQLGVSFLVAVDRSGPIFSEDFGYLQSPGPFDSCVDIFRVADHVFVRQLI